MKLTIPPSFIIFHLLCHVHPPLSLFFVILPSFFSSSLSFVILFFVQSLFFRNSSLLFLSSSHSCHFHPPLSSCHRSSFIIIVSFPLLSPSLSFLSSVLLSLSIPLRFLFISFSFSPLFEDEQKDRGGVGMRMAKKGKKVTKKEK